MKTSIINIIHFLILISFLTSNTLADEHTDLRIYQAVEIEFPTELGKNYTLQSSPELDETLADWQNIDIMDGDGNMMNQFLPVRDKNKAFYRVLINEGSGDFTPNLLLAGEIFQINNFSGEENRRLFFTSSTEGFIKKEKDTGGFEFIDFTYTFTKKSATVGEVKITTEGSIEESFEFSFSSPSLGSVILTDPQNNISQKNFIRDSRFINSDLAPTSLSMDEVFQFNSLNTGTPNNSDTLIVLSSTQSIRDGVIENYTYIKRSKFTADLFVTSQTSMGESTNTYKLIFESPETGSFILKFSSQGGIPDIEGSFVRNSSNIGKVIAPDSFKSGANVIISNDPNTPTFNTSFTFAGVSQGLLTDSVNTREFEYTFERLSGTVIKFTTMSNDGSPEGHSSIRYLYFETTNSGEYYTVEFSTTVIRGFSYDDSIINENFAPTNFEHGAILTIPDGFSDLNSNYIFANNSTGFIDCTSSTSSCSSQAFDYTFNRLGNNSIEVVISSINSSGINEDKKFILIFSSATEGTYRTTSTDTGSVRITGNFSLDVNSGQDNFAPANFEHGAALTIPDQFSGTNSEIEYIFANNSAGFIDCTSSTSSCSSQAFDYTFNRLGNNSIEVVITSENSPGINEDKKFILIFSSTAEGTFHTTDSSSMGRIGNFSLEVNSGQDNFAPASFVLGDSYTLEEESTTSSQVLPTIYKILSNTIGLFESSNEFGNEPTIDSFSYTFNRISNNSIQLELTVKNRFSPSSFEFFTDELLLVYSEQAKGRYFSRILGNTTPSIRTGNFTTSFESVTETAPDNFVSGFKLQINGDDDPSRLVFFNYPQIFSFASDSVGLDLNSGLTNPGGSPEFNYTYTKLGGSFAKLITTSGDSMFSNTNEYILEFQSISNGLIMRKTFIPSSAQSLKLAFDIDTSVSNNEYAFDNLQIGDLIEIPSNGPEGNIIYAITENAKGFKNGLAIDFTFNKLDKNGAEFLIAFDSSSTMTGTERMLLVFSAENEGHFSLKNDLNMNRSGMFTVNTDARGNDLAPSGFSAGSILEYGDNTTFMRKLQFNSTTEGVEIRDGSPDETFTYTYTKINGTYAELSINVSGIIATEVLIFNSATNGIIGRKNSTTTGFFNFEIK